MVNGWQHHKEQKIGVDNEKIGQILPTAGTLSLRCRSRDLYWLKKQWLGELMRKSWNCSQKKLGGVRTPVRGQFIPTIPWILIWFSLYIGGLFSASGSLQSTGSFMLWYSGPPGSCQGPSPLMPCGPALQLQDRTLVQHRGERPQHRPGSRACPHPPGKGAGSSSGHLRPYSPPGSWSRGEKTPWFIQAYFAWAEICSKETPKSEWWPIPKQNPKLEFHLATILDLELLQ